MDNSTINQNKIELRSEKVRKLIGDIPSSLVIWGTAIIAIILFTLLTVICLLPYPYSDGETIIEHLMDMVL
jgi:hypothetical protein